jgi:hypothetical protein
MARHAAVMSWTILVLVQVGWIVTGPYEARADSLAPARDESQPSADITGADVRRAEAFFLAWKQVLPCLNVGVRVDLRHAEPGAPFWGLPFIDLRGIPAMRYQGNDVLVAETELRCDVTRRWSLVGFAGVGRASRDLLDLPEFFEERSKAQTAWNAGAGFRYLIARRYGLRMGIDIARGPEDWAFYITVGSSWLRF